MTTHHRQITLLLSFQSRKLARDFDQTMKFGLPIIGISGSDSGLEKNIVRVKVERGAEMLRKKNGKKDKKKKKGDHK